VIRGAARSILVLSYASTVVRRRHGGTFAARHLRHRRGLRRPLGRRRCGRVRRIGRVGREGQDGRRLPQYRLRALESADRRRQARPRPRRRARLRRLGGAGANRFRQGPPPRARRHRRDCAERFEGALQWAGRAGDRRRRDLDAVADYHGVAILETRGASSSRPAPRRRFRRSRGSKRCPTSPTKPCSISPRGRST